MLLISSAIFAQKPPLAISGPCSLTVGQQVTYSVPIYAAQCYDWDINNTNLSISGNVKIVGSDQSNSVTIEALSTGTFSLKVTYFNENGCNLLTLGCTPTITPPQPPCDFTLTLSYNYINNNTALLCTAQTNPNLTTGVTYNWTATFQNGSFQNLTTSTNQASFNFYPTNAITNVSVHATYLSCYDDESIAIPCNIDEPTFTTYKNIDGINFNIQLTNYNPNNEYNWSFTYGNNVQTLNFNGSTLTVPITQFNQQISSLTITVTSDLCQKKFTYNYIQPRPTLISIINPIKDKLDLNIEDSNQTFKGKIIDINGVEVSTFNNSNYKNIDLSHLKKSIYLIKIYDEEGKEILSEKIIKE